MSLKSIMIALLLTIAPVLAAPTAEIPATSPAATLPAGEGYFVANTWTIDGDAGWNSIAIDDQRKLLYIPRGNRTQVIDASTGKTVAEISHINGAHGIALVPDSGRGFISNAKDGTVTVFDLKTHLVQGTIPIAAPNGIASLGPMVYDPASKRLLVCCPPAQSLIPFPPDIDLKTGQPDRPIPLQGKPEALVADGQGMVYIPLFDRDEIAVLDTRIMKVATAWRLAFHDRPTNISLDPVRSRLFVTCRTRLLVLAAVDGHELASLNVPVGTEDTTFFGGKIFAANPDGALIVIGQSADGQFEVQQTLPTALGVKTVAVDSKTGDLYLPVAEFLAPKGRRPAAGTFKILLLQKSPGEKNKSQKE